MRNTCARSGQSASFDDPSLLDALEFMLQQIGDGDDTQLRSGRDKPDWPRFLFIMVINFLTRSIFDNEKPKEPFRDLFSAYLIYMTTRELWQLPERLLPLPPEDHRARSVTKPPPPPRSSRGKSHSVAGLSPTRYHFLDSTRCI